MNDLAEDILDLVGRKGKVEIPDLCDRFNITKATANWVIGFLVQFGFARYDKSKKYIMLSSAYKRFLEGKDD